MRPAAERFRAVSCDAATRTTRATVQPRPPRPAELMSGTKPGWFDADRSLESPLLSTVCTNACPTPSIDEMAAVMLWPLDLGDRPASAQSTLSP